MTRFYIVPVEDEERNLDTRFVGQIRAFPELIRCKDCRWFYPSEKGDNGWCSFSVHGHPTADEYCSSAERRTDNG